MIKTHTITEETKQTGSSSHYNIPFYTKYVYCSCGWSSSYGSSYEHSHDGYTHTKQYVILKHKIDVLLEAAGILVIEEMS